METSGSGVCTLTYSGVRGTLPVPGPASLRYGGNTSCVALSMPGDRLFIFDGGTGIKPLSNHRMATGKPVNAKLFISHPGACLGDRVELPGTDRAWCYITDNELFREGEPGHSPSFRRHLADFAAGVPVPRLHLFHHDPDQDDAQIDAKQATAEAHINSLAASLRCESPVEGSVYSLIRGGVQGP